MKKRTVIAVLVTFALGAAPRLGAAEQAPHPKGSPTPRISSAPDSQESGTKVVHYATQDIVPIKAKVRFSTLIVLPANESVMDFTVGDKEFWIVEGSNNFVYLKPAKVGARTNLNLVTAAGNVYSFALSEVSENTSLSPDLKVIVDLNDSAMTAASTQRPRFVSTQEVDNFKDTLAKCKEETKLAIDAKTQAMATNAMQLVTNVRFAYRYEAGRKPFFVRSIFDDGVRTYVQARPEETPTLYEIQDGKPNLIAFEYKDGFYIASKIIDRGYLAVGKKRLAFTREE